jgi:hypothetical protein
MKGTDSLLFTGTFINKNLAIWKQKFFKIWQFGQIFPGVGINHFFNCMKIIFFTPFFEFICLNQKN